MRREHERSLKPTFRPLIPRNEAESSCRVADPVHVCLHVLREDYGLASVFSSRRDRIIAIDRN